jgi:rod shape-determining protein MreC
VFRNVSLYVLPAALCLLLIFSSMWLSSVSPMARQVQTVALDVMEPVISLTHKPVNYIKSKFQSVSMVNDQANAVEELRRENEELKQWMQIAHMMKAENKALKKLLNVQHDEKLEFTSAKILSDKNSSYAHTVLVQLAKGHKVAKGQAAIVDAGLIGRVVEAGDEFARIMLLQDMNARIPVVVEETGDKAILTGANSDYPTLEHLSPYHMVKAGQKVLTSGHGGALPYGIEVGETALAEDGTMTVKLFADSSNHSFVKIVDYDLKPLMSGGAFAAAEFSNIH